MLVRRVWFKKKLTKDYTYVYKISGWFLFGIIPIFIYISADSVRER